MAYSGLESFVSYLEKHDELQRIKVFADPVLEITEICDRITKVNGKALLFENTGTKFPLLINAFGSEKRMAAALGRNSLENAGRELEEIFNALTGMPGGLISKIKSLPGLIRIASILPSRSGKKGACQAVVNTKPDLSVLPVLKCWPFDGGRFVTLPMVHTFHPETGKTNVGMYRMQILDSKTTAMHWQRHKTGASHYEVWKKKGSRMPVTVTLGGDPVYTYAATAPLPENINEYILAGFLRQKKVRLVKCITNEIYVPDDADIVIEGYVDTSEELVWEGPFGDHTGFYSLADWYPKFHVTCITHRHNAIYPATIVGVPPQEDAWLAKATETLFLAPVRMALQPEVLDFHMPDAGVAHNLVIVKIRKTYPGQGMKVLNSLFGAGQMMFSKYIVVVSGETDIRDYRNLLAHVFENTALPDDLLFCRGPLDVLDHSSDAFSFGGKLGVDATVKHDEEKTNARNANPAERPVRNIDYGTLLQGDPLIRQISFRLIEEGIPVLVISADQRLKTGWINKIRKSFEESALLNDFRLIVAVDERVSPDDYFCVAWQALGNTDPLRDHIYIARETMLLDGTTKAFRSGGFPRRWPNVVCSSDETISTVDAKWESYGVGAPVDSPSLRTRLLKQAGQEEIVI